LDQSQDGYREFISVSNNSEADVIKQNRMDYTSASGRTMA